MAPPEDGQLPISGRHHPASNAGACRDPARRPKGIVCSDFRFLDLLWIMRRFERQKAHDCRDIGRITDCDTARWEELRVPGRCSSTLVDAPRTLT